MGREKQKGNNEGENRTNGFTLQEVGMDQVGSADSFFCNQLVVLAITLENV